jgi:CRP-like cAMP-binding protein
MVTTHNPSPPEFSLTGCLARHPFFDALAPDDLAQLATQAAARSYSAGEILFLEGDPCSGMWMIEQGSVKVFKLNPEGAEHILHLFGPGDTFNEIPALDGGPNPANAAAITASTCWLLPSEVVIQTLNTHPGLALAVIGKLTARIRTLVGHIDDLALYPVAARLARFLLEQADSPTLQGTGVTRAAIAAHLATTPETVSRVLRSFEQAGAVHFDRHSIVIADPAALRTIALL